MTFDEYQSKASETAIYPDAGNGNIFYPVLGLSGEAGEICNKVKKIIRDNNWKLTEEVRCDLIKELGDVLWYLSQTATELNASLDEIATSNVNKLKDRQQRGVLKGSGDNR